MATEEHEGWKIREELRSDGFEKLTEGEKKKKKQRREVKATEKYKGGAQYLKAGIRNVKLNERNECKKYISLIFE